MKKKVGVCLKAQNNSFWHDIKSSLVEYMYTKNDIELIIQMPNTIYESQESIIKSFLDKVDGILWSPSDNGSYKSILDILYDSGLPVVIIDSFFDKLPKHPSISTIMFDNYAIGKQTAEFIRRSIPPHSTLGIIAGPREGNYTAREQGCKDILQEDYDIADIVYADFQEDKTYTYTEYMLQTYPDIKGIFCTSDNMALGCSTALQYHDRMDVKVFGCDATKVGRRAVEIGQIESTIDVHYNTIAKDSIDTIISMINGGASIHTIYPVTLITASTATQLPKSIIQKRNYTIIHSTNNLQEFNYGGMKSITVCPIIIGDNMRDDLPPRLKALGGDKYCIITDTNVQSLYGDKLMTSLRDAGLTVHIFSFDPGEKNKTFSTIETLCNAILDTHITKKSVIIALGGGVVGNIAGLVANLLMRGIRFVQVPTTVMHQVDASTGGKQAVNTYHGKNMLGSFYEPEFIYNDISCIQTLSTREYANGIAEVIKHGLCDSPHLLSLLVDKEHNYQEILEEALKHKIAIMQEDPREHNKGYILIYGHTIGHAIETLSHGTLLHGEAIAIGMTLEAMISHALGYCSQEVVDFHRSIFAQYNLPTSIPPSIAKADILAKLLYDKKERRHSLCFPLLQRIGQMLTIEGTYAIEVPQSIIEAVIEKGY